jgi:RNA polymerase sigma factor for flagellar operon FliA
VRTTAKERQRLVDANVPFVRSIAAKVKESLPREIEFDDLVAYGMQGLLEAADRFDARHGTSFTTFAYYRVRGAIFDGLRGMGWLPRAEYMRLRFEERAGAYLQNLLDRELGAQALGDAPATGGASTGTLTEELQRIADAFGGVAAIFLTSLEAREEAVAEGADDTERDMEDRERARAIRAALDALPEKERRLLELYYFEDKSLGEAAEAIGLSKSWASRLHARAIMLLKEQLERSGHAPDEDERRTRKPPPEAPAPRPSRLAGARSERGPPPRRR